MRRWRGLGLPADFEAAQPVWAEIMFYVQVCEPIFGPHQKAYAYYTQAIVRSPNGAVSTPSEKAHQRQSNL